MIDSMTFFWVTKLIQLNIYKANMINMLFELKHLHVDSCIRYLVWWDRDRRGAEREARRKWRAWVVCVAVWRFRSSIAALAWLAAFLNSSHSNRNSTLLDSHSLSIFPPCLRVWKDLSQWCKQRRWRLSRTPHALGRPGRWLPRGLPPPTRHRFPRPRWPWGARTGGLSSSFALQNRVRMLKFSGFGLRQRLSALYRVLACCGWEDVVQFRAFFFREG